MKKIILILFVMVLMSILVNSLITEYISPPDEFYLIKGGAVMGNISFEVNTTPTGVGGTIQNVSLYHNISGTWGRNYTNDTDGTLATETYRLFSGATVNMSIFSVDLTDGLVFIWNALSYDNVSSFISEDITLDADVFTVYDNNTNLTGHGLCSSNASNRNCITITAGRGRVVNYPISSLDGVANTTDEALIGRCTLNGSNEGYFRCNQTQKTYNYSGTLLSTENFITSSVKVNYTISYLFRFVSANRTVHVEDAPNITINYPSNNGYSNSSTITVNYTVRGDSATYLGYVYSNDTGDWIQESGGSTSTNDSIKSTSTVFTEGKITWNLRSQETGNSNIYGWIISNQSITIDTTNPVITRNSPDDNTYVKYLIGTDGYSAKINITVTDKNADYCTLKLNGTVNRSSVYTDGTHFDLNFNASDGNYKWSVNCSDAAGRKTETTNRTITIDTTSPKMSRHVNYTSTSANCKGFTVEFNFDEEVNSTFTFGTSAMAQTHTVKETDYSINQTFTLTFNDTYESSFYSNMTACDRANNCNGTSTTYPEMIISSPIPLCTGWSLWSVYDSVINLSDYRAASGADYVYYWNNTGQSWIYSASAGSLQDNYNLGIGDVVQLYESINTTYFRNNTGSPGYHVNVTGGHAYFGLYHGYSLGNISYNLFRNESRGNLTPSDIWAGGLEFRIDYLSSFNNSNQEYVDAIYLWDWNNATALGKISNGLDTVWAYINYSLSINITPGGEIIGNWT